MMSSCFTRMGAGAAQWEVTTQPKGAVHAPMPTVPTTVCAVASVCPTARCVAHAASGVVGDRSPVGSSYGIAPCSGSTASRNANRAYRFDRTSLATHPGADRLEHAGPFRRGPPSERATVATGTLRPDARRYAEDRPMHADHAGVSLWWPSAAVGVVPLVGEAGWSLLEAGRPTLRSSPTSAAAAGPAGVVGRSWPDLTETNQAGVSARLGLRAARAKRDHAAHRATRGTAGACGGAGPGAWGPEGI